MNSDIRLSIGFFDHPKIIKLERQLGLEGVVALMRLWLWAAQNRPSGALSGMDDEDIAIAARWNGEATAFKDVVTRLKLLDKVGLLDKKDAYPDSLSGGQKQRVAIARTLMMEPDIILFDEPTSALDPEMVTEVLNMISELAGSVITMIIVSHEMNFIKKCASRVLFLENGTIEFDGTVSEAFDKKENKRLNDFLSSIMH